MLQQYLLLSSYVFRGFSDEGNLQLKLLLQGEVAFFPEHEIETRALYSREKTTDVRNQRAAKRTILFIVTACYLLSIEDVYHFFE